MGWVAAKKGHGIPHPACRWFRGLVLGLTIIIAAPAVRADELNLLINGYARHINPPKGTNYNERNWGWGLQYDYERVRESWIPFLMVSGFKDSERNMSYYAGGGSQYRFDVAPSLDKLHVDAGVVAFLMTRKNFKNGNPFFGVLPALTVGTTHVSVNITYIPKVDPKMVALWFFQLKVPLAQF